VDADTGQIIAAELTSKDVDDGSQVGPLLEQIAGPVHFVARISSRATSAPASTFM
jgi:hypothetical protein